MPEKKLTADNEHNPAKKPEPTSGTIDVTGRLVLDLPESEHRQKKRGSEQLSCLQNLKRDLFRRVQKANFLLEILGILIVSFYAYQAYLSNYLTRATDRPWLGIRGMRLGGDVPLQAGKPNTVEFVYENTGNSPALYFRFKQYSMYIDGFDQAERMSFPKNYACGMIDERKRTGITVLPNVTNTGSSDYPAPPDFPVANIQAGKFAFLTMGCFVYEDHRGETHHTTYCEYTVPDSHHANGLNACFAPLAMMPTRARMTASGHDIKPASSARLFWGSRQI
jgi:hypothetical protein